MSDLSRFLLVSNGNVTGIVDRLVSEGLVARAQPQWRPPHLDGAADRGRAPKHFRTMAAAHETLDRRTAGRRQRRRGAAADRHAEVVPQQLGGTGMTAMAGLKPKHFLWQVEGKVAQRPARPAGAQEPADLRFLCRAARHVPRPRLCRRRRRRGVPVQRRQFLLRRRCPRHHRPAGRDGHEGAARLHPHDRRSRQGDAQLRQADHRGGRRRRGRRRRHHRHGLRHPHRHAGGQDRLPVHPRRARRLRHGRLRDPAAHHRPGPRRRAALHRPHA